jgi:hypothetical protein
MRRPFGTQPAWAATAPLAGRIGTHRQRAAKPAQLQLKGLKMLSSLKSKNQTTITDLEAAVAEATQALITAKQAHTQTLARRNDIAALVETDVQNAALQQQLREGEAEAKRARWHAKRRGATAARDSGIRLRGIILASAIRAALFTPQMRQAALVVKLTAGVAFFQQYELSYMETPP